MTTLIPIKLPTACCTGLSPCQNSLKEVKHVSRPAFWIHEALTWIVWWFPAVTPKIWLLFSVDASEQLVAMNCLVLPVKILQEDWTRLNPSWQWSFLASWEEELISDSAPFFSARTLIHCQHDGDKHLTQKVSISLLLGEAFKNSLNTVLCEKCPGSFLQTLNTFLQETCPKKDWAPFSDL